MQSFVIRSSHSVVYHDYELPNQKQTNNYAKHEKQRFARQVAKHFAVVNVRLSDWL